MGKNIIEISDVEHVASLSRLEFSEEELKKIQEDLSGVVNYFSLLSKVDTANVEISEEVVGALREDKVKESMAKEEVIKNAPFHNDSAFIVPRVVE